MKHHIVHLSRFNFMSAEYKVLTCIEITSSFYFHFVTCYTHNPSNQSTFSRHKLSKLIYFMYGISFFICNQRTNNNTNNGCIFCKHKTASLFFSSFSCIPLKKRQRKIFAQEKVPNSHSIHLNITTLHSSVPLHKHT